MALAPGECRLALGVVAGEDQAGRTPQAAAQTTPESTTEEQQPAQAGNQAGGASAPAGETPTQPDAESSTPSAGFAERGRMRRRARFLRKARELAYRDLGGLVFDLHRFGQRNDPVVLAKLATLGHIDAELRALEQALHEVRPVTVLHEVGIGACPRCAALHGNDDRFCPGCGLAFDAKAERPLSTAPVTAPAQGAAAGGAAAGSAIQPAAAPHAPGASAPTPTQQSPAPVSAQPIATPTPSPGTAEAPSTGEALTSIFRPFGRRGEESPPVKQTAAPVAARPTAPAEQESSSENGKQESAREDEPTEILRPPARGA